MSRWGHPLVVVWQTFDSSGDDVAGQRFDAAGMALGGEFQGQRFLVPLFADGFEFGDMPAWSNSTP